MFGTRESLERHLISADLQEQLKNEYTNNNYALINEARDPEKPDSREYTFDIDILQAYLDYVRSVAADNNVARPRIKICMGQYPTNDFDPRLREDYKGHQCVYLRACDASNSSFIEDDTDLQAALALNFAGLTPPPPSGK